MRIVAGLVPAYKETEEAHREAADSHMFEARLAHIHDQLVEMRDALRVGDFDRVFETAEHDSLSLAATTMTGPAGWVYWKPETLEIFDTVRELRNDEGIPAYYSTDTGASVYVNTTAEYVDDVEDAIADCGVETDELEGRRPGPNPSRGRRAVLRFRHALWGEYAFSLAARCSPHANRSSRRWLRRSGPRSETRNGASRTTRNWSWSRKPAATSSNTNSTASSGDRPSPTRSRFR